MTRKDILELANTEAGRFLLGARKDEQIVHVVPNGYHIWNGKKNGKPSYIARFNTWDRVAAQFLIPVTKLFIAHEKYEFDFYKGFLHYSNLEPRFGIYPGVFLTTDTFTANGGGQGRIQATDATYATANAATTGTASSATTRPDNSDAGANYNISRAFAPFNTASLPDNATISSGASTFIRAVGDTVAVSNSDADSVSVVASTQASDTALVGGDFDQVGTTKFANDLSITSWNTTGNNDFQLNSSGIANISLTGYSKFAWRTAKDIAATQPTSTNYVGMVDNTNLLSVDYTLAAGGFFFISS